MLKQMKRFHDTMLYFVTLRMITFTIPVPSLFWTIMMRIIIFLTMILLLILIIMITKIMIII